MRAILAWALLGLLLIGIEAKSKRGNTKTTAAEEIPVPPTKKTGKTKAAPEPVVEKKRAGNKRTELDEDNTIEDVDEDKIDEILRDATKNLVIFFYDGRSSCPMCTEALTKIEEIDDDIEATGYIQVVKTDDRGVAKELGVTTFPALVYYRRKNPIMYDGEFKDPTAVLKWVRAHDEVATWELTDDNFESRTDAHSPDEGTLDWFVMFYDADEAPCNSFVAVLETVAHKLRGLVHVGKVEVSINDDVTERFHIDENECPTFFLFHRGKMYRYKESAKDVRSLTNFALFKFKEQRGHRVPDPPTAIEHFYEFAKEKIVDVMEDNHTLSVIGVGGLVLIVATTIFLKAQRIRREEKPTKNE
ncbi:unnamed protein product, partial [Mesorhabditis spiculigera]